MTYFVPATATDVNYIVEVSPDLNTWNSGAGYTQVLNSVQGTNGTTVTIQDLVSTSAAHHFMHLRVVQTQ